MKISYNYFVNTDKQDAVKETYKAYAKKQNQACKEALKQERALVQVTNAFLIPTPYGFFRVGGGNTKVHFPTINMESGLTCSSAHSCPYSFQQKRANPNNGKPLCYAQKMEGRLPALFASKVYQAEVVERIAKKATEDEIRILIMHIATACEFLRRGKDKYIRFSEVGDIGPTVAPLAKKIISMLAATGYKPYLYTKRPPQEQADLRAAGATVVVSDDDFVCVHSAEEAASLKLPVCPGQCGGPGGCYRCPQGKKTAVIAH